MAVSPTTVAPKTEPLDTLLSSVLQDGDTVLVADDDIVTRVRDKGLGQQAITFDDAVSAKHKTGHYIVMARSGECQKVRALQKLHETDCVSSFTYDVLPSGDGRNSGTGSVLKGEGVLSLYLAPYGVDTPYVLNLFKNANMTVPERVLNGAALWWFGEMHDFRPVRFMANLQGGGKPGVQAWFLEGRDLAAFMKAGKLSPERISAWLERYDVQVVYIKRRNKSAQAAMLSVMEPLGYSSLWDVARREARTCKVAEYDFNKLYETVQKLVLEEAELERILGGTVNVKMLTLEELVESPLEALASLAISLNQAMNKKMEIQEYHPRYQEVEGLVEQIDRLRLDMIQHLGLVKNVSGSYAVDTARASN